MRNLEIIVPNKKIFVKWNNSKNYSLVWYTILKHIIQCFFWSIYTINELVFSQIFNKKTTVEIKVRYNLIPLKIGCVTEQCLVNLYFYAAVNKEIEKSSEIIGLRGFFTPSDWIWTSGPLVPNQALCQLSYTRIFSFFVLSVVVVKHVVKGPCSSKMRGKVNAGSPSIYKASRDFEFIDLPGGVTRSQTKRANCCAAARRRPGPSSEKWFYLNRDDLSRKNWFAGQ